MGIMSRQKNLCVWIVKSASSLSFLFMKKFLIYKRLIRKYIYFISHRTREQQLGDYGAQLDALLEYKKWINGQEVLANRGEHYRNYNRILESVKAKIINNINELQEL